MALCIELGDSNHIFPELKNYTRERLKDIIDNQKEE